MQSPIYWHPKLYEFAMKKLYGAFFETRYSHLSKYIPEGSQVLELCMGDLYFYAHYLKNKNIKYSCADANLAFVNAAQGKGIDCILLDVIKDEIPKSDYILIQCGIMYVIPHHVEVIKKLLHSTNKQLIISENTQNVSNSGNKLVSAIGAFMSKANAGQSKVKFNKQTLKEAFSGFEKNIIHWIEPTDSRETIIVLQK